jgi:HSP20 family protein
MSSFFEKLKKGMEIEDTIIQPKESDKEEPLKESGNEKEITLEKGNEEEAEIKRKPLKKNRKRTNYSKPEKIIKQEEKIIEPKVETTEEKTTQINEQMSPKQEVEKQISEPQKKKEDWSDLNHEPEGQLAIDVYQTEDDLVIQTAIAGVKPESLDISIEGDMITIRGNRERPEEAETKNYFYQECFWGPFSRQMIMSVEIDPSRTEATLKNGILTIRIPKIERERKRKIVVKG